MISKILKTTMHLPDRIQAICWVQFWAWIGKKIHHFDLTFLTNSMTYIDRLVPIPLLLHHLGWRSLLPLSSRNQRIRLQRHSRRRRPRWLTIPCRLFHHYFHLVDPPPLCRPIPRHFPLSTLHTAASSLPRTFCALSHGTCPIQT